MFSAVVRVVLPRLGRFRKMDANEWMDASGNAGQVGGLCLHDKWFASLVHTWRYVYVYIFG